MMILAKKRHSATLKRYCCNDCRGWFDAEDLYGPLNTYQTIEKTSKNYNTIMGPWSHGDWARNGKLLLET
jgi:predicted acyl esterase